MSRRDAAVLASRTLALLLIVWALAEVLNLPEYVYSFIHHLHQESVLSAKHGYWYYYYLTCLGFVIVKIVGFSLTAWWLFKGGPRVEKLFLPSGPTETLLRTDPQPDERANIR